MRIRVLLRNGFNVDEIRPVALMHDPRPRKLVCADVIRLYESKVKEIEHRIAELTEIHERAKERLSMILEQRQHGGPEEAAATPAG
jgi:DNA-binding transcriptional MerR regulator